LPFYLLLRERRGEVRKNIQSLARGRSLIF
jgi:hypothetical protein